MYIRMNRVGALYIEISTFFDSKLLPSINKWNKEVILDLPKTQIIWTPWSVLRDETRKNATPPDDTTRYKEE